MIIVRHRCITCGLLGILDVGESPESLNPHVSAIGSSDPCPGQIAVLEGSQADLDYLESKRRKMLSSLGVSPGAKPIVSIPHPKQETVVVHWISSRGNMYTKYYQQEEALNCLSLLVERDIDDAIGLVISTGKESWFWKNYHQVLTYI